MVNTSITNHKSQTPNSKGEGRAKRCSRREGCGVARGAPRQAGGTRGITQLKAQGPSRTCNESKEEEEEDSRCEKLTALYRGPTDVNLRRIVRESAAALGVQFRAKVAGVVPRTQDVYLRKVRNPLAGGGQNRGAGNEAQGRWGTRHGGGGASQVRPTPKP